MSDYGFGQHRSSMRQPAGAFDQVDSAASVSAADPPSQTYPHQPSGTSYQNADMDRQPPPRAYVSAAPLAYSQPMHPPMYTSGYLPQQPMMQPRQPPPAYVNQPPPTLAPPVAQLMQAASMNSAGTPVLEMLPYRQRTVQLNKPEECLTCHVSDPFEFYMHLSSHRPYFTGMMKTLQAFYREQRPFASPDWQLQRFQQGFPCVFFYDDQRLWYRGCIKESFGHDARIECVDYGNDQLVSKADVCYITYGHFDMEKFAIPCRLRGAVPADGEFWSEEEKAVFQRLVNLRDQNKDASKDFLTMIARARDEKTGVLEIEIILPDGRNILAVLGGRQTPMAGAIMQRRQQTANAGNIPDAREISVGDSLQVQITHATSPSDIWLITLSTTNELCSMQERLNEFYHDGPSMRALGALDRLEPGTICVAPFSGDNRFYRAIIVNKTQTQQVSVRFVDFGNTEEVDAKALMPLVKQFVNLPRYAVACRLAGVEPLDGRAFSDEACDFIAALGGDAVEGLVSDFRARDADGRYVVELTQLSGVRNSIRQSIAQMMVNKNLVAASPEGVRGAPLRAARGQGVSASGGGMMLRNALGGIAQLPPIARQAIEQEVREPMFKFKQQETLVGQNVLCDLGEFTAPDDFYVQPVAFVELIPRVKEAIDMHYRDVEAGGLRRLLPSEVDVGSACIARYEQNNTLYRATVIRKTMTHAVVIFIDYGNAARTTEMYDVVRDPILRNTPAISVSCRLKGRMQFGFQSIHLLHCIDYLYNYTSCVTDARERRE